MAKIQCPICRQEDQVIRLAVDLGDSRGHQSVHLCTGCHAVFRFEPLRSLGTVVKIEEVHDHFVSA